MVDLSNLARELTPTAFFEEILPDILGEIDVPSDAGTERLQFHVTGPDGVDVHIGLDADKNFELEFGKAEKPPMALTASDNDFRSIVNGDLRDKIRAATGGVAIGPKQLRKAVMPDSKVQRIKLLAGDLQIRIQDKELGETYTYTLTLGGGTPNIAAPKCSISLDVPTLLEAAGGKQPPQQLFFQGRIRVDGDMSIMMGLMGVLTSP